MYCPVCGHEFREGYVTCSDCDVPLVTDPPAKPEELEPEWLDLVTVFASADPSLILVAQSLLEAEGISCLARGRGIQDILGFGRIPGGINFVTGPAELQVPKERVEEARSLLAGLWWTVAEPAEGEPNEN
jgi:hypothetical protein